MKSDPQALSNCFDRLYHVSEEAGIAEFIPRPSPSYFSGVNEDVVFAIAENTLVNYLLPRDCPRVTYYPSATTSTTDKAMFMGNTAAKHVIIVESGWYAAISKAKLYCYELPPENFRLIDACAGYYVSPQTVKPITVTEISDVISAILSGSAELRFTPDLHRAAEAVKASTLNFSLIRMRNAQI